MFRIVHNNVENVVSTIPQRPDRKPLTTNTFRNVLEGALIDRRVYHLREFRCKLARTHNGA